MSLIIYRLPLLLKITYIANLVQVFLIKVHCLEANEAVRNKCLIKVENWSFTSAFNLEKFNSHIAF